MWTEIWRIYQEREDPIEFLLVIILGVAACLAFSYFATKPIDMAGVLIGLLIYYPIRIIGKVDTLSSYILVVTVLVIILRGIDAT